jgi:hypothetical protein
MVSTTIFKAVWVNPQSHEKFKNFCKQKKVRMSDELTKIINDHVEENDGQI